MRVRIQIEKTNPNAPTPEYATFGASGFDLHLFSDKEIKIENNEIAKLPTGLKFEIPSGFGLFIFSRSSVAMRGVSLANGVGVIDSDYRGEVLVPLRNLSGCGVTIQPGTRIAQGVVMPVCFVQFDVVDNLTLTTRGSGGFGSTGE